MVPVEMRTLILSDIHANLEALEAVLTAAEGQWDELWNLGDLVGYGGSPNQVIDRMRPLQAMVVRGNHDRVCCGLTSALGFNPVARAAATWTHDELTPENLTWLTEMPQGPLSPASDPNASCAHGSPLDEDKYILTVRDAWAPLQEMTTPITFFGHTHIQGGFSQVGDQWQEIRTGIFRPRPTALADAATQTEAESVTLPLAPGARHLINPGSVGQPRDFDWRAAFAIYTTNPEDPDATTITFHRIPYDLVKAQGTILMAGLPERLAARLREGR